jgi:2-polyprenyl-3-methyl-5-hydroxy-6-metoxy-1,4-benzoquinol methylase
MPQSDDILTSWQANSQAWIETIDHQEIASRQVATNAAIVAAVRQTQPRSILDVGCGEGWLSRALHQAGTNVVGIDGVPALIAAARSKGSGPTYHCYSYDQLREQPLPAIGQFAVIVFNFALFEAEPTFTLLQRLQPLLLPGGHIVIQTLALPPAEPSGWRTEDWRLMQRHFPAPFPWYYRSLPDWLQAFEHHHWRCQDHQTIRHPRQETLLSWVFCLGKSVNG